MRNWMHNLGLVRESHGIEYLTDQGSACAWGVVWIGGAMLFGLVRWLL
jgi:hypothetical protein